MDFTSAYREARARAKAELVAGDLPKLPSSNFFDSIKLAVDALPPSLCPDTDIRCINDFVTAEHATTLAAQLRGLKGWRKLSGRKLLSLGGTPGCSGVWVLPLPQFLDELAKALAPVFGGEPADQLLINEYECGQGIAAHKDGPLYESTACILSLDSTALLEFVECPTTAAQPAPSEEDAVVRCSVLLEPCSLCVFSGTAYENLAHRIRSRRSDPLDASCANCPPGRMGQVSERASRISITFRKLKGVTKRLDATDVGLLSENDREELRRREEWWAKSISEVVES